MRMVLAAAFLVMVGRMAAADVVIQADVLALDDADGKLVEDAVVKRLPSTKRCFGDRAATVEVTLTIQNNKLVEATASKSGDAKLDACVRRLVKKMKLASSSAQIRFQITARKAQAIKKIDQRVIDEIMRSPTALATLDGAQVTMGGGTGSGGSGSAAQTATDPALGGHSPEDISRVFRASAGPIRACYEREHAKDPELGGKVVYTVTIDEKGAVTRAEPKSLTLKSKAMFACMSSVIKRLKFAAKGKTIVSFPFIFSPG